MRKIIFSAATLPPSPDTVRGKLAARGYSSSICVVLDSPRKLAGATQWLIQAEDTLTDVGGSSRSTGSVGGCHEIKEILECYVDFEVDKAVLAGPLFTLLPADCKPSFREARSRIEIRSSAAFGDRIGQLISCVTEAIARTCGGVLIELSGSIEAVTRVEIVPCPDPVSGNPWFDRQINRTAFDYNSLDQLIGQISNQPPSEKDPRTSDVLRLLFGNPEIYYEMLVDEYSRVHKLSPEQRMELMNLARDFLRR